MTLVGKILIVLNLVVCICVMAVAMMVHWTHQNWRDKTMRTADAGGEPGLVEQIKSKNAQIQQLRDEKERLKGEKERVQLEQLFRISQLQSAYDEQKKERERLTGEAATEKERAQKAVLAMEATQKSLDTNQKELDQLRQEIMTARLERDEQLKKVVGLEDSLAQAQGEHSRVSARNQQLADELGRYRIALQDVERQLDRTGPPRLEGLVLASSDDGYVEISLGFEDGLEKGHTLEVYRLGATPQTSKYIGKVRIIRTEKERAVAQVIPEFRKGKIERDDRVATKLN